MLSVARSFLAGITAGIVLTGCSAATDAPTEEPQAAICARVDAAVATFGSYVTLDDAYEAVARVVPGGFGGVMTAGGPIFLREPAKLETARVTARRAEGCANATAVVAALRMVSSASAALPGRYDYVTLRRWYAQVSVASGSLAPDFVFSDIMESENRLTFAFTTQEAAARLRAIVAGLGIPAAAVNVVVTVRPTLGRAAAANESLKLTKARIAPASGKLQPRAFAA